MFSICKIEFQAHFVRENFLISDLFFEIITIRILSTFCSWEFFDLRYIFRDNYDYNVIHTIIYIYIYIYILAPFGVVLVLVALKYFGTRFPDTWGYFFTHKKENYNYDQNWLKKGVGPLKPAHFCEQKCVYLQQLPLVATWNNFYVLFSKSIMLDGY